MGALHAGHLSIIKKSLQENNITVVSIFINPKQFNEKKDFVKYPRNLAKDIQCLSKIQVDYVFCPEASKIFSHDHESEVSIKSLEKFLCGPYRPGHFVGVATICSILFHIIPADHVYFGQKDYQQALIIQKMIKDLFYPIKFCLVETIRDENGLALSSRNQFLSKNAKANATLLYKELEKLANEIKIHIKNKDLNSIQELQQTSKKNSIMEWQKAYSVEVEYLEICHAENLNNIVNLSQKDFELSRALLIAVAFYIEEIRIIDNILIHIF